MPPVSRKPAFDLLVLGSSGGPLETDVPAYALKPADTAWEDGWVGLEGGSGMGALSDLLRQAALNSALLRRLPQSQGRESVPSVPKAYSGANENPGNHPTLASLGLATGAEDDHTPMLMEEELLPGLIWPEHCRSAVERAGWFYGFLSCYLVTHAHLDHVLSLILATGSLPPRQHPLYPYLRNSSYGGTPIAPVRMPIYAQRPVLNRLSTAFRGDIWPELGDWAGDGETSEQGNTSKADQLGRREVQDSSTGQDDKHTQPRHEEHTHRITHVKEAYPLQNGVGVDYCSLPPSKRYQKLPLSGPSRKASGGRLGISTSQMPVAHGNTSKGVYESTAFFVRLDEYSEAADDHDEPHPGAELLFWGDVESKLDDHNDPAAQELHASVWREAAKSWDEGRLTGIFIECSYTSDRPADLMFGHLQPQSLHAELRQLASFVKTRTKSEATPLEGLKVYIIHVKQPMDLDPGSRNCRERIRNQLVAIEKDRCSVGQGTGVSFEMIAKGMLIRV